MKKNNTEGKKLVKLTVRLSPKLFDRVQIRRIREHVTLEALAARAFEAYLKAPIPAEEDWED
jgi:hypothetical protein